MEIAEFLLARIAEDEAADEFLQRFAWARVLAECDAKRQIVEEHGPFEHEHAAPGVWCRMCVGPAGFPTRDTGFRFPCRTLRFLALPYADHPDYREEWKV